MKFSNAFLKCLYKVVVLVVVIGVNMAVQSCMFVMKVKAVMSAGGSQSYVLKNTTTGFCFFVVFLIQSPLFSVVDTICHEVIRVMVIEMGSCDILDGCIICELIADSCILSVKMPGRGNSVERLV